MRFDYILENFSYIKDKNLYNDVVETVVDFLNYEYERYGDVIDIKVKDLVNKRYFELEFDSDDKNFYSIIIVSADESIFTLLDELGGIKYVDFLDYYDNKYYDIIYSKLEVKDDEIDSHKLEKMIRDSFDISNTLFVVDGIDFIRSIRFIDVFDVGKNEYLIIDRR